MAAVPVNQEDTNRMVAYETDVRSIFIDGTSGGTPILPSQFSAAIYDGFPVPDPAFKYYMQASVLALFRLFKNGPTKFPTQLPSYPKASLPSASANSGCMIFVTDDIGGSVPAFSDGSSWRRVTDRNVIA